MKPFFITIDTEGDNLWEWRKGKEISTKNTRYLQRFQNLCDCYGFKPIWLTNYEMMCDSNYVDFISRVEDNNTGELGMHLHAWNNPPYYELNQVRDGQPFLIEYPDNIMESKIAYITELIQSRTGIKPISHRAGRWVTNSTYFKYLHKYGYKIDCSYTPYIDWEKTLGCTKKSKGNDYSSIRNKIYNININDTNEFILEIPVSIIRRRIYNEFSIGTLKNIRKLYYMIFGKKLWLRPNGDNLDYMMYVAEELSRKSDYLEFMIHSSELMPGGSPNFKDANSIESLYQNLESLFKYISIHYYGCTFKEYYYQKR